MTAVWRVSERHACRVLKAPRSTQQYKPTRDDQADLKQRIKENCPNMYKGEDVVRTLEQVCKLFGYPKSIRADNGPEFISRDLDLWAYQKDVIIDFFRSHCPAGDAMHR